MIFDTHCHLNSDELYKNIDRVIKDAQNVGVNKFLVVGYDKKSSQLAVEIANKYECCYAAVGYHPSELKEINESDLRDTLNLASNKKVIAIGEIGLDYYWDKDTNIRNKQKIYFIKQIEYANEIGLPIVIHNRDAMLDCINILKENKPLKGGIMHCYGGSVESLKDVIDLGLCIGIGGVLTFKNAKTIKDVVEAAPIDKIVLETDSPYLTPHPYRGTLNEPRYITYVLDELKSIKSEPNIEDTLYSNSLKILNLL